MSKEYKQSRQALWSRILWLLLLPVFMIIRLEAKLPEPHFLVVYCAITLETWMIFCAIWLHYKTIRLDGDSLIIKRIGGTETAYLRRLIEQPVIEKRNIFFVIPKQLLIFRCHELGTVSFQLTELSDADRQEFTDLLKAWYGGQIEEIEL